MKITFKYMCVATLIIIFFLLNSFIAKERIFLPDKNVYVGEFNPYYMDEETFFDYVNVGTSHGSVSIVYEDNGLNLARSGQSFKYDYLLLDFYKEHISDETIIIVPISMHSFCNVFQGTIYEQYEDDYMPILGMKNFTRYIGNILTSKDIYSKGYKPDEFDFDYTKNSAEPNLTCNEDILIENIGYVESIIDNFPNKIVLVTTPYYYEAISEDESTRDKWYSIIAELDNRREGVVYLNYLLDERFFDTELFYNISHLNTPGRRYFSEILFNDIEELEKTSQFK